MSVGSCWTWNQSSRSCPTHSTSSLKIFTSAFWDPRDCHSAAKYHSSSPGCCINVNYSSMQTECSLTFRWWKCLECWSMSVTVNSLDSHGEWSRSFLKCSRSYTFNSGFSWAGLGWRLVKELIHGLKSTGPRIEGTQGQAIFPVSQGWHQQLTSAFLCLARWRLQPLRFDKCSVCFFWLLSLQSPLCTRFDLVIVIWVIFIRVYKCLQRLLRLIQPLHEVPEAGLGQDYVSCKDTHAVDPGQLGGLCLKTILRSWFPPSLTLKQY